MEFGEAIVPSRVPLFSRENIKGAENDIKMAGTELSNSLGFSSICFLIGQLISSQMVLLT